MTQSRDILGDVNNDGMVNIIDVTYLLNFILGEFEFTEEQLEVADYNEDGFIDVIDIHHMIQDILG